MKHTTQAHAGRTPHTINRYNESASFVPALPVRRPVDLPDVRPADAVIDLVRAGPLSGHARQDDTAITHAQATLIVAAGYLVGFLLITVGLIVLAYIFRLLGSDAAVYFLAGLILWGFLNLVALAVNRGQGLWHSPSGIAHHEIDSRERIAELAIRTHAELLKERFRAERGQE